MSSTPAKKRAVETAGPSLGSLSFAAVLDSPPLGQRKYGFLGAGVMASAMIAGILRAGTTLPENVMASDPSDACLEKQKSLGVRVSRSNREVAEFADVLFIAVKPLVVPALLADIRDVITRSKLVVSIAAGVTCSTIEEALGGSPRVIRVMPNTPCLVSETAAGMAAGKHALPADLDDVGAIFSTLGKCLPVTEAQIDAVTGLSGSGPAYVFMMIEALADGGVRAGLPRPVAMTLAIQLVKGSAIMAEQSKLHPGELKDQVCSPGGTTIAGVHALEKGGFRAAVMDAVVAATERSKELGAPARL